MDSNVHQQMMFQAQKKSVGASYLLWFFVGGFGGHRFYLGQTGTAIAQLMLLLLGWIPFFLGWFALGIWLFVDLFLIPGMAERKNIEIIHGIDRGSMGAIAAAQRFE